jgi:hypothetical protein
MTRHKTNGARILALMLVRVRVGQREFATWCPFTGDLVITSGPRHAPSSDWIPRVGGRLWRSSPTSSAQVVICVELGE